ncbi:hypothetical protein [Sinomonas sp. ASV322]|uniref:hypothetical protein n=1 Tax=Sinomonas sp. ASV322 TaxID=3041920 RepID=UPI0027DE7F7E|nr:hypothetical protein [Sinomonas sp. ASV322]MDQ4501655.1 hypothetical protein [Sinomonas sp. ASV322]
MPEVVGCSTPARGICGAHRPDPGALRSGGYFQTQMLGICLAEVIRNGGSGVIWAGVRSVRLGVMESLRQRVDDAGVEFAEQVGQGFFEGWRGGVEGLPPVRGEAEPAAASVGRVGQPRQDLAFKDWWSTGDDPGFGCYLRGATVGGGTGGACPKMPTGGTRQSEFRVSEADPTLMEKQCMDRSSPSV